MSYLTKDYEISVWEDEWSGTTGFTEKKLAVIGSNTMTSQARVFSPQFVKNTNGTKTLTFKLYKKFVDNVTGEKVHNPFYDYLIAERKVKLKYKGEWHDFLVKNITENSADYLYTYQMEDAFVHELSRNGFDVIFDEKINNNIGTARELGRAALQGTDWTVESDLIIQTSEESLVYVQLPDIGTMTNAVNILDSANMTETNVEFAPGLTVLAFYSSCTSKPRRFQFIYSNDHGTIGSPYPKNSDRVITLADCQYYIDMSPDDYKQVDGTNFYLPKDWTIKTGIGASTGDSTPISHLYRGARYVYGQYGHYHPGLDRYVTEWATMNGRNGFFGYTKTEYNSPVFIQNYAVNSDLENGSAGWYLLEPDAQNDGLIVSSLSGTLGQFDTNGIFHKASDLPLEDLDINSLKSYLEVGGKSFYNTGLTDNRKMLDLTPEDRLVVTGEFYDANGIKLYNSQIPYIGCELVEADISSNNKWQTITHSRVSFVREYGSTDGRIYFKPTGAFSKQQLQNNRFKLRFFTPGGAGIAIHYARNIQIFKEVRIEEQLVLPSDTASLVDSEDIVKTTTVYFREDEQLAKGLQTPEEEIVLSSETGPFKPRYRARAEAVREIAVKESNYFNILQTIAETFGVWLKINVSHDNEGNIGTKKVEFVNYIGKENYAGFRYGVNLKGIQRTQESKNIVTKLIVKPNNNQYGKNGFCTIARAAGNETGETSIYNFQYYYNCGLLNEATITDYLYNANNEEVNSSNAKNYYGRLSKLNSEIRQWEEERNGIRLELVNLRADRYSQETIRDSTQSEMGDIARRFRVNYENEEISSLPSSKKFADSTTAKQMYFEWIKLQKVYLDALYKVGALGIDITNRENRVKELEENIERNKQAKNTLHLAFYTEFYRFIREGTWMSEDYLDDDKYYIDAQSTLYNSCFPKAAYQIDVASLSGVEGYEGYEFEIGDETRIYDPEFFGTDEGIVIAVTETVENLDDPTQASIKVQNFKNEFQDLFQKITATVQQTQYSTGAYHKAVEFVEADESTKLDFLGDAFNSDTATLSIGGQATVVQDASGISIIDKIDPYNALRLLGGKIMISRRDEQGNRYWATGMSSRGISADLITAGTINTGILNIMSDGDPAFRWDVKGISAYSKTEGAYNRNKFTRFDRFGFYGINDSSIDGQDWSPENETEISNKASFYLTWEGLKVRNDGVEILFGKQDNYLLSVFNNEEEIFSIKNNGDLKIKGTIEAIGGSIGDPERGQGILYINVEKTIGGDEDKGSDPVPEEQSSINVAALSEGGNSYTNKATYFQKGMDIDLNLQYIGYGLSNNLFYLGEGGLIFRNPNFRTNTGDSPYRGLRISSTGMIIEGNNRSRLYSGTAMQVLGNGLRILKIQTDTYATAHGTMDEGKDATKLFGNGYYYGEAGTIEFTSTSFDNKNKYGIIVQGSDYLRIRTFYNSGRVVFDYGTVYFQTPEIHTTSSTFNCLTYFKKDIEISGTSSAQTTFQIGPYVSLVTEEASTTTSDLRAKNSIQKLTESYNSLFDKLNPCTFKYNTGLSNRIHTGFIAQEVLEAVQQAGLTSTEFAAYVQAQDSEGKCGLRYTEFIALNTWQIQRLKPRMTAAEQEIAALKQEIAELKSQLQKLQ